MSDEARRSKPYVRPATREDCIILARNLRQEDAEEIAHVNGLPAEMNLLLGFRTSARLYAVVWGDETVAVFGIGGVPGVIGFPWMLASPSLSKIRKSFLRECRGYVEGMLQEYRHLENYVWAKNEVHIQWLKWLGFEFEPAAPFGINDEPFHRFYRSM
ncbi:hypothetical protein RSEGYP2_48 [Ralstonia phage RsoP1EGY]|uniref:Internal virion protein A n=1 Tax=Ralstonia phage RsoP1EGY TaxID=2070026 RepID=A0A2R2ZGD5_9CAUD|nr:internal virion protein [Ralstonia phage RsoP1EGY]AUO78205.1 hypothetical protein RSEGYP2_48 [Ralstonia phage RsoP1EGY]